MTNPPIPINSTLTADADQMSDDHNNKQTITVS